MKQWWTHHSSLLPNPPLDEDQRQLVESLTGRIPLLLRALFEFRQQGIPFDEDQLLQSNDFRKVKDDIFAFYQGLKEGLNWSVKKELYVPFSMPPLLTANIVFQVLFNSEWLSTA